TAIASLVLSAISLRALSRLTPMTRSMKRSKAWSVTVMSSGFGIPVLHQNHTGGHPLRLLAGNLETQKLDPPHGCRVFGEHERDDTLPCRHHFRKLGARRQRG